LDWLKQVCRRIVATAKLSFAVDEIHAINKWTVKCWYAAAPTKHTARALISYQRSVGKSSQRQNSPSPSMKSMQATKNGL